MVHATRTAFGQPEPLCEHTRRYLWSRAAYGGGQAWGPLRYFESAGVTCEDCAAILRAQSPNVIPTPEVVPTPPPLKNPLGAQIRADMLKRWGPSIAYEDWEVEEY